MNKIVICYSIIIIGILSNSIYPKEIIDTNSVSKVSRIDIEANTGLIWLLQIKGNVNINNSIFIKCRHSESLLSSESGFTAGYQTFFSNKSRLQTGLGYSYGKVEPFVFGEPNADATTEYWNGVICEFDFIHYFNINFIRVGINAGMNVIISNQKSLPSLNLGLVVGVF